MRKFLAEILLDINKLCAYPFLAENSGINYFDRKIHLKSSRKFPLEMLIKICWFTIVYMSLNCMPNMLVYLLL